MIWRGSRPDRRLVEDQDVGVVDQRLGQADALAVALGEPPDQLVGHIVDPHLLHHVPDALAAGGAVASCL